MPGPGRRKGSPKTRDEIVGAARVEFGEHGFDNASVRQIATRANVDPSLVYHYFADKAELFVASLDVPLDPREALATAVAGNIGGAGERVVRVFLSVWELDQPRAALLGMLRSSLAGNDHALEMLGATMAEAVANALSQVASEEDIEMRALGIGSQLIGMAILRYVAKIEPLASAEPEEIVALIGPRIQSYIVGADEVFDAAGAT